MKCTFVEVRTTSRLSFMFNKFTMAGNDVGSLSTLSNEGVGSDL